MIPELKRLHSPDIYDLKSYRPPEEDKFAFLLQAMIGAKNEEGDESFDITVCTPRWIIETHDIDSIIIGRHYLIVLKYDYHQLLQFIERFLRTCSGKDWEEVASKVSRLGHWEFEDYVDYS
jgi:hypothetical protein